MGEPLKNICLNIGIPDSAFLNRESRVKLKRDQINDMLSARMNNKLHYISCPIKYERGSKNFESEEVEAKMKQSPSHCVMAERCACTL